MSDIVCNRFGLLAVAALVALTGLHCPVAAQPASNPIADDGPYQTMCVRTCDGFYFPLHQNAHRQNFAHDAEACSSACTSDARLFYFPVNGGKPATMIDLDGHKYADEPHAFAFRQAVVPGCTCHPAPWSKEAAARHHHYAVVEIEERRKAEAEQAKRDAAEAEKASAAISAAAAHAYYESDAEEPNRW
jgi:hypothetical protein